MFITVKEVDVVEVVKDVEATIQCNDIIMWNFNVELATRTVSRISK